MHECPLKRDYFNRTSILQPFIFRGHIIFLGSILGVEFASKSPQNRFPSRWLSHPSEKYAQQIGSNHFPKRLVWKFQNIFELPPPRWEKQYASMLTRIFLEHLSDSSIARMATIVFLVFPLLMAGTNHLPYVGKNLENSGPNSPKVHLRGWTGDCQPTNPPYLWMSRWNLGSMGYFPYL